MVKNNTVVLIALIVALGGLLMGFHASFISDASKFIKLEFDLSNIDFSLVENGFMPTITTFIHA